MDLRARVRRTGSLTGCIRAGRVQICSRMRQRSVWRSRTGRPWCTALLVLLIAPALLLRGQALVLHSHGETGGHYHSVSEGAFRLAAAHTTSGHALEPGKLAESDGGDSDPTEHHHDTMPAGIVISFPHLDVRTSGSGPFFTKSGFVLPVFVSVNIWNGTLTEPRLGCRTKPPGRPPDRGCRSGVVSVLRGSHAILV